MSAFGHSIGLEYWGVYGMAELSKLGEALKLGEQIRSLADALFDSYQKLGKTRRTLRDERKRDDLEFALDEIRWRLYGRYSLIHDVEDFVLNPSAKRAKFACVLERSAMTRDSMPRFPRVEREAFGRAFRRPGPARGNSQATPGRCAGFR